MINLDLKKYQEQFLKRSLNFIIIFSLILIFVSKNSSAQLSFNIKNEDIPKTKILFLGFDSNDSRLRADISAITEIIKRNLASTDLFEILKQGGSLSTVSGSLASTNLPLASINEQNIAIEALPDFEKYRKSGVDAILIADFSYNWSHNLELKIRMWDVLDERQLFGKYYTSSADNYHKMANLISDEIFKSITKEKLGHFNSQILYVVESGSVLKRIKKIILMDFDGSNRRVLTDGNDLVLTPIFSKKKDEILFLRYKNNHVQVTRLELNNLRLKKIGGFKGTTFAASVHPQNPNLILISAIENGNSDIYEVNLDLNSATKLTKNPAIDTTPYYSADGKFIVFASDREGGQKLYIMNADGGSVKKISQNAGNYSKPVWSPNGNLIAFTKIIRNQFYIGLMSVNGKNEKLITSGYVVEGARWSPNGRYLIYSKKKGPYKEDSIPRLYTIDIITGYERELPVPAQEGATDPDWALL
jgi:TolB protein